MQHPSRSFSLRTFRIRETKRKQIQQRKPKKQADPEELMDYNPDSDVEPSPVSYFDFFGNNDEELEEDEEENEGRDHVDYDDAASENEEESWDRERYDEEEHYDEDDHEDMDDDEGEEELARVRRSLGLHLQGSFGGLMSDMTGRLRSILTSLKNDEPTMQLVALQELAEILSVSSEDNLAGYFASDSFVKELVRIMKGPNDLGAGGMDMSDDMMLALAMSEGLGGGNPELTLLACRCISNLLDAMPTAVTSLVYHGAIGVLCQKLKSIEYIDLAEQALSVSTANTSFYLYNAIDIQRRLWKKLPAICRELSCTKVVSVQRSCILISSASILKELPCALQQTVCVE